jgi:hypothetical protein
MITHGRFAASECLATAHGYKAGTDERQGRTAVNPPPARCDSTRTLMYPYNVHGAIHVVIIWVAASERGRE